MKRIVVSFYIQIKYAFNVKEENCTRWPVFNVTRSSYLSFSVVKSNQSCEVRLAII